MGEEVEKFCPSMLGLRRVDETKPVTNNAPLPDSSLNCRGMPVRKRKKNPLFYSDNLYNYNRKKTRFSKRLESEQSGEKISTSLKRKKRVPTKTPASQNTLTVEENNTRVLRSSKKFKDVDNTEKIASFRNLIKLSKARNWLCSEFFYSIIDKPIFDKSNNDFVMCLEASFPELKNYNLSRVEWCMIRRMLGKPRRCSRIFYNEEIIELNRKRSLIRCLQQGDASQLSSLKDIPNQVPAVITPGASVTVRLYRPLNSLFCGRVDEIDVQNNKYTITFESRHLGTRVSPDYDISDHLAPVVPKNKIMDTLRSISRKESKLPKKLYNELKEKSPVVKKDHPAAWEHLLNYASTLAVDSGLVPKGTELSSLQSGDYPSDAVKAIVKLQQTLRLKRGYVSTLRDLNRLVELKLCEESCESFEKFDTSYSCILSTLEYLNTKLEDNVQILNEQLHTFVPQDIVQSVLTPIYMGTHTATVAADIVHRNNLKMGSDGRFVKVQKHLDIICSLMSLLLQIKNLSEYNRRNYEVDTLCNTMKQIKSSLSPLGQAAFEEKVEVPMEQICISLTGSKDHSVFSKYVPESDEERDEIEVEEGEGESTLEQYP